MGTFVECCVVDGDGIWLSLILSPSELNDIDSEDEEDTTKDYDSDEDLQV